MGCRIPRFKENSSNLIGNAKRFRKEGWGNQPEQEEEAEQVVNKVSENQKQLEWTTEVKINLVVMDNEERSKGRGFMKRVKERWDQSYPEYSSASWQKLRDNSARFKKEPDVMNLILVRQREEQQEVVIANENVEEPIDSDIEVIERVIIHDIQVEEDEQMEEILEKHEQELETLFIAELENMTHSAMLEMEPHMKLPKVKLDNQTCHIGNKILALYLRDVDTIPEICDKVYAMGRAIASEMGVHVDKEQPGKKKGNAEGGNHQERKLKKEIKELQQKIAKTSNELYRRKQWRKATAKEKAILKELSTKIQKDMTSSNLRKVREIWLDQMRNSKATGFMIFLKSIEGLCRCYCTFSDRDI